MRKKFIRVSYSGFSLLELMIVLTIIAILAAIAIPNYQLYVKKAKFSEVITQISPYKTSVELCFQLLGSLGDSENNCGTPGKNEVPPDFMASDPKKNYVAKIYTVYQQPDVHITAVTQGLGKEYNYTLIAHLTETGEILWSVDPSSTCLIDGLCHS